MTEAELYLSGMSIPEVHKETGTPLSTLRFRFKKLGILRSRTDAIRNSVKRGRHYSPTKGKTRVFTQEWKDNISKSKRGKGKGYSLKPNGYLEITMGEHKGRSVHTVAMEIEIGRKLYRDEVVHHIDHNRSNNDINNLQLMSRKEHARLHALENNNNRNRDKKGRYL